MKKSSRKRQRNFLAGGKFGGLANGAHLNRGTTAAHSCQASYVHPLHRTVYSDQLSMICEIDFIESGGAAALRKAKRPHLLRTTFQSYPGLSGLNCSEDRNR